MKPSVYFDATIPSYIASRLARDPPIARCQRLTRVWWHRYRRYYELLISDRVIAEAAGGGPALARRRLNLLDSISALYCEPAHLALAEHLMGPGRLPFTAHADAEHIAIAACHSVNYLLTWSCGHLANPTIAGGVARACAARGLALPKICTPETLMRTFAHEKSHPRRNPADSAGAVSRVGRRSDRSVGKNAPARE